MPSLDFDLMIETRPHPDDERLLTIQLKRDELNLLISTVQNISAELRSRLLAAELLRLLLVGKMS